MAPRQMVLYVRKGDKLVPRRRVYVRKDRNGTQYLAFIDFDGSKCFIW